MTERNSKREPASAQPPLEPEPPKLGEPTAVAAGPKAVMISIQHALRQMGAGRSVHALSRVNQTDGFDCMGCAWPDPEQRKAAEFCENGAKAVAEEATTSRVDRRFFSRFSVQELAEHSDHWLGRQGRLTEPMLLRPGSSHYEPIGWTDAFRVIANHLHALETPDEACFYTSGRASNEAAFVYQLFARAFGTNNLPDCSNLCHESSGVALNETIGSGKGTVTLEDFEHADCILMIGQNPGTNHPRMLSTLQDAARRGCAIITVNPLAEAGNTAFRDPQEVAGWAGAGTQFHAQHLRVRINGDVALLKGLAKTVLAEDRARPGEVLDRAFIEAYCDGFDAFVDGIDATEWSHIVASSGVPRDAIERAGRRIARSERVIACWAMGVTQHDNAVANIQEIVNLLLLGGHLGRPGAGACPVRGHSNVQGDRTMGIWERPSEDFLDALAAEFDFAPPRAHGFDAVAAIRAMHDGRARVLIALGGNLLSAASDTEFTADALRRCALTVQISTKLNRSHLVTGEEALILPCLGRTERDVRAGVEQFITVENSMGYVHRSRGSLPPPSEEVRSEVEIIASMAEACLGDAMKWSRLAVDNEAVRDRIGRVVPGFENFNHRIQTGGFHLPHPVRDQREFRTAAGKARFTVHPIPDDPLTDNEFMMMTLRTHDQYNTTIYGEDDRYRGIFGGRRVVLMNKKDMEAKGLRETQRVDLASEFKGVRRTAPGFYVVSYDIPQRCVATYFPEANVLVPIDKVAEKSHTPSSKSVIVTITPSA